MPARHIQSGSTRKQGAHMEKQYNSLREKIAADKLARAARDAGFQQLFDRANAAGFAAGDQMTVTPMCIVECDAFGKPIAAPQTVWAGACGFASVKVRKANQGFGHWLIKSGHARKAYNGGAEIWISAHGQSYERKTAHAIAMAQAIRAAGIDCFADSRLD